MKLTRKIKITNDLGIHIRPATSIVRLLQSYQSDVWFTYKKDTVNARSILSILMLAAKKNTYIEITVEGDDAEQVMSHLVKVFENNFEDQHAPK